MTTRPRRVARRLLEVFDYRTFVTAGAFLTAVLIGYLMWGAFSAAHDATQAANQRGRAATRRIDLLNQQIQRLQTEISKGSDQRGQLAAAVAALSAQIKQLGGQPVIMVTPGTTVVTVRPQPTRSATARPTATSSSGPRPKPTATGTATPGPTPTPTTCPLIILC